MTLSSPRAATSGFAQLFQLAGLARQHAAVDLLPARERLLGDASLPAHVADRRPAIRLLQDRRDLLERKSATSSRHTLLIDRPDCAAKPTVPLKLRSREPLKSRPLTVTTSTHCCPRPCTIAPANIFVSH